MGKKLDEEKLYRKIEQPFDDIDKNTESSVNDLIYFFKLRFNKAKINYAFFQKKRFYKSTIIALKSLFNGLNYEQKKNLASTLVEVIREEYCPLTNGKINRWFFAAVLHYCFEVLKEIDEPFRVCFGDFDLRRGLNEAFCRLVIISKIEIQCRYFCNGKRKWYGVVIQSDGEIIKEYDNFIFDKKYIEELWLNEWCYKEEDNINTTPMNAYKTLLCFFNDENYNIAINKSTYWNYRKAISEETMDRSTNERKKEKTKKKKAKKKKTKKKKRKR